MKKTVSIFASTAILSLFFSCTVLAQEAKSEKEAKTHVQFRQALLQLVRSNMGPLGGMAKGKVPFNTDTLETNGIRLEQLGLMMADYFATDTRKFDVETGALPKIWESKADFDNKAQELVTAARALQVAANSGDEGAYRNAISAVGGSCKGCHDEYKKD